MVVNDMQRFHGVHGWSNSGATPSMESLEVRLLLAVTGLDADFDMAYVWPAPQGTMSFQATDLRVSPSWQIELANTRALGQGNWTVDGLTFNAPYALADLFPAGSSATDFSYTWSNLVVAPGQHFDAGASQQGESAVVSIPVSVTRSFVGSQITGSGEMTTTVTVVPEAGLANGFQAEIDVYAVQSSDGQLDAQPFGTVLDDGTVQSGGTVAVDGGSYFQKYQWSVPQAVAGETYVFSCTVHVELNDGVAWARIEPSVRVGGHKLGQAGTEVWTGNTLDLPNTGSVAIDSADVVSDDNPATYLNWYGVSLPFFATAGAAPIAPTFDAGSDVITNPYLGLRQVGDIYTLAGSGDFAGQFRAYSLNGREQVLGVNCMVLGIDTYAGDADLQYYDLRIAQDIAGNLRVLEVTGLDAAGHDVNWQAGSVDQALVFMPAAPAAGDQLGWLAGQATWIDSVEQSTATLDSGLGPYHHCAIRGWADGLGTQYAWLSSGVGVVQEQWTAYDGTSGAWERVAPVVADVSWAGIWRAGGYQMDSATGQPAASSTQSASNATVIVSQRPDGRYQANVGNGAYTLILTGDGDILSGEATGTNPDLSHFEFHFRMLEVAPGVALVLYGQGGYDNLGAWWGSAFAGLAHLNAWTPSGRLFVGDYDVDKVEIRVDTTGGWDTRVVESTPGVGITPLPGGMYAWHDLANPNGLAPVFVQNGSRLIRNTADYAEDGNFDQWFTVVYRGPGDTLYYLGHEAGFDGPMETNLWWASFYVGVAHPKAGSEWQADLAATVDMSHVPPVALRGQTFPVPIRVSNLGSAPAAGKVRILLYASTDQTLGAGDVVIGSLEDQSISIAGKSAKVLTVNAQIPDWMAYDDYNLIAVVDADNAIPEVSEDNNQAVGVSMFQVDAAKRDLVGQFGSITLGDVFVPGDKGTVPLTITNVGNIPIVGKIDIAFYLSTDQTLDVGTDYPLATLSGQSVNLVAGAGKVYTARFTIGPDAPAGTYYVLADIDPGGVIDEVNTANNVVASLTTRELAWEFGAVGGRKNVKLTVADAAGVLTTFSLTGPGWGQVLGGDAFTGVKVTGSAVTSVLKIATPAGKTTTVGGILLHGDLRELNAPSVALTGDLTAELSLRKVTLGDVSGGRLLVNTRLTYPAGDHTMAIALGRVDETSIDTHGIPISSISAVQWLDDDATADQIAAPWVGKLTVSGRAAKKGVTALAGDFQADLVLSGTPLPARQAALGGATVAGLADGLWSIGGDAGAVHVGQTGGTWDFDATGSAVSLDVAGDLAGTVSAQSFGKITVKGGLLADITALAAAPAGGMSIAALTAGAVRNVSLDVPAGIGTVTVVEWLDADGSPDLLQAGWIGQLVTTGRKAVAAKGITASAGLPAVAGDFQAGVTLTGAALPLRKIALGGVKIAGSLSGSAWDIQGQGDVGPVAIAGSVDTWTAAMGKLASLTAGAIGDADLTARDALGTVKALSWASGGLTADSIGTLNITGRTGAHPVAGNYGAALTVTGPALAGKPAFATATIAGDLTASIWDITGNLGKLTVTGRSVNSTIRTTGSMASLTFGATDTSQFLAGIDPDVLDYARLVVDFVNTQATIGSIAVRGWRLASKTDPTDFVNNTQFSAATIGTISLTNTTDAAGADACGLHVLASDGLAIRSIHYVDTFLGNSYTWNFIKGETKTDFRNVTIDYIAV